MDVREKLVELIGSTEYGNGSLVGKNFQKGFIEKIASNLIAHGVTVQEWIPVSEPPKKCGRYYTNRKLFGHDHVEILRYGIDSDGGYWSYYDDEYGMRIVQDVTHWMPLPTPPKQEG